MLTVCEVLSDLQRYEGRSVIVVGRSSSSDEGVWLEEECGIKVVNGGREFSPSISLAYVANEFAPPPEKPRGFKWDKRLLQQKLQKVTQTTQLQVLKKIHYTDHWLAVFGRLETKLPQKVGLGYTYGFGHQSESPAQLIAPRDGFLYLHAK